MTKVTSEHELYPSLLENHLSSKGDRFADDDGLLWQQFDDNNEIFFVDIPRGTPDTFSKDGKWDKYYGVNNVQAEA